MSGGDPRVPLAVEQDQRRVPLAQPPGFARDGGEDLGGVALLDHRAVDLPQRLDLLEVALRAVDQPVVLDRRAEDAAHRAQDLHLLGRELADAIGAQRHHAHGAAAGVQGHERQRPQPDLPRRVPHSLQHRDVADRHRGHGIERASDRTFAAAEARDLGRVVLGQPAVVRRRDEPARFLVDEVDAAGLQRRGRPSWCRRAWDSAASMSVEWATAAATAANASRRRASALERPGGLALVSMIDPIGAGSYHATTGAG